MDAKTGIAFLACAIWQPGILCTDDINSGYLWHVAPPLLHVPDVMMGELPAQGTGQDGEAMARVQIRIGGARMEVLLYDHNMAAYEAAVDMMGKTGKAAVIHPTGYADG